MSLRHLLRRSTVFHRLCTSTTTITSSFPISSLHQRFYNISISPETISDDHDPETISDPPQFQIPRNPSDPYPYPPIPLRTTAFSTPEEAAAERRRRKGRLGIEPSLNSLRKDPSAPRRDPNAPRFPESTSMLTGQRLNLHNRVQSLIRASDLDAAAHLARNSVLSNPRPTVFTCNAIIAAMYKANRYSESVSLFQYFFKQNNIIPNIVSYNQIIDAHCDAGHVDEALEVYRYIIANAPFAPSSVTYRYLTRGLVQAGRIREAVSLLREMLSKGQAADSMVYNNLIKGYLDLGDLDKANELFDELKSRCTVYDGIVNATFMEFWFEKGNEKEAMESYWALVDKKFKMHPATGNVLLGVFLRYGKKSEAWDLFNEMLDNHIPPNILSVNSDTISIMVNECFKMGQFTEAVDTFRKVGSKPKCRPFVMGYEGYRNIITRFCEQGMLMEAESFFSEGVSKCLAPDVPSHRVMIDAYLKAERIDDALKMLNRMVDVNLRVVADFGTRVFRKLIQYGKLTESAEVLTKMGKREPKPDPSIYDLVVRGLCDGVALDLAKDIVSEMVAHRVEVAPVLREFIIETFGKAGRREEIEKTLNTVPRPYIPYIIPGQSGNTPPSVPPVLRATPAAPQQLNGTSWPSHRVGLPSSGWANGTAGQTATGTYKDNNGQNPSWSNTSVNQQQQSWSNQTGGQPQPSWSSQAPGYQRQQSCSQQPGWSSPSGYQQSWANQTTGQQQTWANQTPTQQPWANQTTSQQQTWANQSTDQQQTWASQTPAQQPWANQNSNSHQQAWANQNSSHQQQWRGGRQQSWSNQRARHQQQSQWSNHMQGQVANQAQWSNSVNGHHPQQHEAGSSQAWQYKDKNVVELRN